MLGHIPEHPGRKAPVLTTKGAKEGGERKREETKASVWDVKRRRRRRKSNHNFAAQSCYCGEERGGKRSVFATVEADRSAGHSNTEFPVWHFTKPFEQDGA